EGCGCVLAELGPRHDVEERRLFLPFVVHLIAPVDGNAEAGHGAASGGEAEFRVARDVADDGDGVVCHWFAPRRDARPGAQAGVPASTRPRRAASASGRRISLWRTTSSARRSDRSNTSRAPGSAMRLNTA